MLKIVTYGSCVEKFLETALEKFWLIMIWKLILTALGELLVLIRRITERYFRPSL